METSGPFAVVPGSRVGAFSQRSVALTLTFPTRLARWRFGAGAPRLGPSSPGARGSGPEAPRPGPVALEHELRWVLKPQGWQTAGR